MPTLRSFGGRVPPFRIGCGGFDIFFSLLPRISSSQVTVWKLEAYCCTFLTGTRPCSTTSTIYDLGLDVPFLWLFPGVLDCLNFWLTSPSANLSKFSSPGALGVSGLPLGEAFADTFLLSTEESSCLKRPGIQQLYLHHSSIFWYIFIGYGGTKQMKFINLQIEKLIDRLWWWKYSALPSIFSI